jgi:nucleotide-binding universal stress UspA family protein
MAGVVVGVDGSEHSRLALGWAMHEAALREVPLTVMAVRPVPARPATEIYWPVLKVADDSQDEGPARAAIKELADKVASESGVTAPDVRVSLVRGDPATELLAAARDADLLVVGSRGTGAFASFLMGSVSTKIMHQAPCPVAVIPANR